MRKQDKNRIQRFSVAVAVCVAFFLLPTLSSVFTSCSPETENIFGESAAIRLQKSVVGYTEILESNTRGWAMDFYPGQRVEGGIAYTAQFKDGKVTLRCERAIDYSELIYKSEYQYGAGDEVTSGYTVKSENSVLLTFDTFNALIHYWSQPFGLQAAGYASDYEFTFLSACADSVVLRGKKYDNRMCLYPLSQEPKTYIGQVASMRSKLSGIPRHRLVADGQTVIINCSDNHLKFNEGGINHDIPFIYTATGIRFYQTVKIRGIVMNEMTFDAASQELRTADGRLVIPAPTLAERFVATHDQWYLDYDKSTGIGEMCDELKTLVETNVKSFKSVDWGYEQLQAIYIGANLLDAEKDAHRMVMGWTIRDNYGSGNVGYFGYAINMELSGDDQESINMIPLEGAIGFGNHIFCQPLVDFIGNNSPYRLTFDDSANPKNVTLTSVKDSGKWFKLSLR